MSYELLLGDCLGVMRTLPSESVQMCCSSPPYFGLRDYQTASWEGGSEDCDHEPDKTSPSSTLGGGKDTQGAAKFFRRTCPKCGAVRVDNQIGLEETPEAYIAKLVEVFREVNRLLRDDGTLWLNLGDSYNGSGGPGGWADNKQTEGFKGEFKKYTNPNRNVSGLKPKDLIGIPWMSAFALRADGWYLRSDIIWHKPNPMPESVTDRPTKSHEYLFLLSKSREYFYDADAIKEPAARAGEMSGGSLKVSSGNHFLPNGSGKQNLDRFGTKPLPDDRNRRSVWTVATKPYGGAHFATFPPELIEPCILAGSKPGDTVLDCFNGAATTGLVALKHGRNYIGVELNPDYVALSHKRLLGVASQQRLFAADAL